MTVYLQLPKPRPLPLKRAQKAVSKKGVVTISLINPPLTYRTGSRKTFTSVYYHC